VAGIAGVRTGHAGLPRANAHDPPKRSAHDAKQRLGIHRGPGIGGEAFGIELLEELGDDPVAVLGGHIGLGGGASIAVCEMKPLVEIGAVAGGDRVDDLVTDRRVEDRPVALRLDGEAACRLLPVQVSARLGRE
jgi:hypothetical protein